MPLACAGVPFFSGFTTFTIFSRLSNSFSCLSVSSRALPAFMRPAKSRSSLRALRRREFDWQFKMTCSFISLSGFAKSQVFVPGGDSYMEQTGMLVGNFDFKPLKETIWAWLKQILTPNRDRLKEKKEEKRKFDFCFSSRNSVFLRGTLNETLAA